jgi:hypothetical protein
MPVHKYIKFKKVQDLKPGDLIRHRLTDEVYTVINCFGDRVTAVKVADVTNASEWLVLQTSTLNDIPCGN